VKSLNRATSTLIQPVLRRRGAVFPIILVCVMLCAILLASVVQSTLRLHGQQRREEAACQALSLAETLLATTLAQQAFLATDGKREWLVPSEQLAGRGTAAISVQSLANTETGRREVLVSVVYPADSETPSRVSLRRTIASGEARVDKSAE